MTGGSLGSRLSGSFGSLQQQGQNGYITRRPSKTSLNGYREKEKFFSTTFRYLSRKKVAMLVLTAFAVVAFMTGFFTVNKEDDFDSSGLPFDVRYLNQSSMIPSMLPRKEAMQSNSSSHMNKVLVCNDSTYWSTFFNSSDVSNSSTPVNVLANPCKDFAFPPPPPGDTRRIGPRPCPVCYVPVEQAIARMPRFPSPSPVLQHLTYFSEENSSKTEANGGSEFGGYPTLKHRNDSFNIKESMTVHCGFIKGCKPGHQTGFDIDMADLEVLGQLHEVIVASAIFGNYDVIQQPKNIGETARKNVPFYMFVDEETETYMKNSSILGNDKQLDYG